jgi:protein-tyrosine phosphatase
MSASPFRILVVCTGNICRSPAADLLLVADLAGDERFVVGSAGTQAMAGWPVSPPMAALLTERGIRSDGFVARQATRALLGESDLILTATREHREWVAAHDPRTIRRAFTMTEFSEALRAPGHADPATLTPTELVAWATSHRPHPRLAGRGALVRRGYADGDILDPYGRGDAAYISSLTQIEPLTAAIAEALRSTR